jgi:hypothetical protein
MTVDRRKEGKRKVCKMKKGRQLEKEQNNKE